MLYKIFLAGCTQSSIPNISNISQPLTSLIPSVVLPTPIQFYYLQQVCVLSLFLISQDKKSPVERISVTVI